MRRTLLFMFVAGVLFAAAPAASGNLFGKYIQSCPQSVHAQDDPIVAPGLPGGADHDHTASGSLAFGANMTTGSMLAAGTTCILQANHTAYWAPTVIGPDGVSYPASFSSYYAAAGADPSLVAGGRVQPFPTGIRFIVGNSKSTVLQSTSVVRWRCYGQATTLSAPPQSCPVAGKGFAMEFTAPMCWDGMNLDTPDHKAHMSGASAGNGCPASHPVRLPQLQAAFSYPAGAIGGYLSSDHGVGPKGRTAHFDVWEAWSSPNVQDQLTRCLNDPARNTATAPLCGVFTYNGGTNPPNAWLPYLLPWATAVGYVQSNGNPSYVLPPAIP
jgi:hypothetical protein